MVDPKKLRWRIRRVVHEGTGRSSTQIKTLFDADCSPLTVRRHPQKEGLKELEAPSGGHLSSHATNLPVWTLQGNTKHGTLKSVRKFYSLMRKNVTWTVLMVSSVTGMTRTSHCRRFLRGSGGGSIMILGAFSFNGTMALQVVQGRQTAAGYVEMLQRASLLT